MIIFKLFFFFWDKPATLFPATVTPESQNQQWRPPEKRRGNEARRVPEKQFKLSWIPQRN